MLIWSTERSISLIWITSHAAFISDMEERLNDKLLDEMDEEMDLGTCFTLLDSLVKVFRIIPEFRILRLTFHTKSATKC